MHLRRREESSCDYLQIKENKSPEKEKQRLSVSRETRVATQQLPMPLVINAGG